jgi:hypothetical protein
VIVAVPETVAERQLDPAPVRVELVLGAETPVTLVPVPVGIDVNRPAVQNDVPLTGIGRAAKPQPALPQPPAGSISSASWQPTLQA